VKCKKTTKEKGREGCCSLRGKATSQTTKGTKERLRARNYPRFGHEEGPKKRGSYDGKKRSGHNQPSWKKRKGNLKKAERR